jgi:methionyl-tRNA synthetase
MPAGLLGGLVVNEFYALEGLKFSTSRRHAVWAEDFLATEDPALARLYLGWDRPSGFESDFTLAGYVAFRDWAGPLLAGPPTAPLPHRGRHRGRHRGQHRAVPVATGGGRRARPEAAQALRLETFDPALAARCLLGALSPAEPGQEDAARPDRRRPAHPPVTGVTRRSRARWPSGRPG